MTIPQDVLVICYCSKMSVVIWLDKFWFLYIKTLYNHIKGVICTYHFWGCSLFTCFHKWRLHMCVNYTLVWNHPYLGFN